MSATATRLPLTFPRFPLGDLPAQGREAALTVLTDVSTTTRPHGAKATTDALNDARQRVADGPAPQAFKDAFDVTLVALVAALHG